MTTAIIILVVIITGLLFFLVNQMLSVKKIRGEVNLRTQELENYKDQFKDIIDINKTLATKNDELKNVNQNIDNLKIE